MHFFCNLQSRARTHAVLVIGLYELLCNPTEWDRYPLYEPPGPFIVRYSQLINTLFSGVRVAQSFVFCVVLSLFVIFSSPRPKVHVNYCHHLASVVCRLLSVVCKLFTFQASSPKPLGRLEPNFAGMFLGWSSTKLLFFVLVGYSIWLPGPIMCSDWLKFQRSSSLKLMN